MMVDCVFISNLITDPFVSFFVIIFAYESFIAEQLNVVYATKEIIIVRLTFRLVFTLE